jgi:hypothetical protein
VPLSFSLAVTDAPCTIFPAGSVTAPLMEPVSSWASADAVNPTTITINARHAPNDGNPDWNARRHLSLNSFGIER